MGSALVDAPGLGYQVQMMSTRLYVWLIIVSRMTEQEHFSKLF